MKDGLTELVCILDRSGSMDSVIGEAISGVNTFIKDQRKVDGQANVTIALFDIAYDLIYDNVNIDTVPDITRDVYYPRGMTALYDAIGKTIDNVGNRLANTPEDERPENVIVAILTDGMENSSYKYTSSKVKDMIKHQEDKYNWTFIYLAANQNAFEVGQQFGMSSYNSINFNATANGTTAAFANISNCAYTYRTMSKSGLSKEDIMSHVPLVDADGN